MVLLKFSKTCHLLRDTSKNPRDFLLLQDFMASSTIVNQIYPGILLQRLFFIKKDISDRVASHKLAFKQLKPSQLHDIIFQVAARLFCHNNTI